MIVQQVFRMKLNYIILCIKLFVQQNLSLFSLRFMPVSACVQRPVENIAPVHVQTFNLRCELKFCIETEATSSTNHRTQTKTNTNQGVRKPRFHCFLFEVWSHNRVGQKMSINYHAPYCVWSGGLHILSSLGEPMSPHPASISISNLVYT